jgi:hypothetical protein
MNLLEKLQELKGKTFNYENKNVTLENFKHVSGIYVLFMPNPRNFLEFELESFFKEIGEVEMYNQTPGEVEKWRFRQYKN